jgi:hypothetical protein
MLRRTALKAKPKRKSAELKRFHTFVAEQGCLVCGSPAIVHHVRGYADKAGSITRDHWLVTPLCPAHHDVQHGRWSVHSIGHQAFWKIHGIDLYDEATRLAEQWHARAA